MNKEIQKLEKVIEEAQAVIAKAKAKIDELRKGISEGRISENEGRIDIPISVKFKELDEQDKIVQKAIRRGVNKVLKGVENPTEKRRLFEMIREDIKRVARGEPQFNWFIEYVDEIVVALRVKEDIEEEKRKREWKKEKREMGKEHKIRRAAEQFGINNDEED